MSDLFDTLTEAPKKKKKDLFDDVAPAAAGGDLFDQVDSPAPAETNGDLFDEIAPKPETEDASDETKPLLRGTNGQPRYPETSVAAEILKGLPGLAADTLREAGKDTAAAAAYEGAGAVKGATLGYVDPTNLVDKGLDKVGLGDTGVSKNIAEGTGQFIGAVAPISKLSQAVHAGMTATGILAGVRPVLSGLVQSGIVGSIYGAARKPGEADVAQEGQLATRAHNALDDAATFIVWTGAGQLVDQAAQALGLGKTNAYNNLRQDIIDKFTSKGASPEQAEAMADAGLKQATKGKWEDVTASDLRTARRAVRAGQKIVLGEGEPAPPSAASGEPAAPAEGTVRLPAPAQPPAPEAAGGPPAEPSPQPEPISETSRPSISSEVGSVPQTRIDEKTVSGPGIKYLQERFPALAAEVVGKTVPLETEQLHDVLIKSAGAGEEVLLKGGTMAAANEAALQRFHEIARPLSEANAAKAPPTAAPAAAPQPDVFDEVSADTEKAKGIPSAPGLADVVKSLGIKPHEMSLEQYGQAYGENRSPDLIAAEHKQAVKTALKAGETVPPETLADHPTAPIEANKELARDAAQDVLKKNKIDDHAIVRMVDHIVGDNDAFKMGYGKEFNPETTVIRGATRTPIDKASGDRLQTVIDLADGAGPRVGRHEAFHAVTNLLLDEGEHKILLDHFGNHEAAADAFADYRAGKKPAEGAVEKLFRKIREFLKRLKNYFKTRKFATAEDIFEAVDKGEMAGRPVKGGRGRPQYGIREFFRRGKVAEPTSTRTPEFAKWFGDSKIVQPNGRPSIVYHGTNAGFNDFSPEKRELGFHFAKNPEVANNRIDPYSNDELKDYGIGEPGAGYQKGARVLPVFLSVKNPIRTKFDVGDWNNAKDVMAALPQAVLTPAEEASIGTSATKLRQALQAKGYDGIAYTNQYENNRGMTPDQRESYIAFEPNQIKSAFNAGGFNESPDIRYSAEEQTPEQLRLNLGTGQPFAEFIGYQETGAPIPLFNIAGAHPLAGSTVSAETLAAQGIEVPDHPPYEVWKNAAGDQNLPTPVEENLPVPATEREHVPTFYSQLQKVMEKKLPPKAPASQIKGMLANSQDIKKEEIEWSGINEWLDEQKGSVTKEQVMGFLRANETNLVEQQSGSPDNQWEDLTEDDVHLVKTDENPLAGEPSTYTYEIPNGEKFYVRGNAEGWSITDGNDSVIGTQADFNDVKKDIATYVREHEGQVSFPPKWAEYTLPGPNGGHWGEDEDSNYRELLLTLPGLNAEVINDVSFYKLQLMAKYGQKLETWLPENIQREAMGDWLEYLNKVGGPAADTGRLLENLTPEEKSKLKSLEKKAEKATFTRSHFSAKNVIAHARLTDRSSDAGENLLFAEELQSDWFGKAHKARQDQIREFVRDGMSEEEAKKKASGFFKLGPETDKWMELEDKIKEAQRNWRDTDNLPALKQKLKRGWYYDEKGVDTRTNFTEEEMKELRNQAVNAALKRREEANNLRRLLIEQRALTDVGNLEGFPNAPFKNTWIELLAKRLLRMAAAEGYPRFAWTTAEQQTQRWSESYEEKYELLYDEVLPRFLNKYLKKWGVQVEKVNLSDIAEGDDGEKFNVVDSSGETVQSFGDEETAYEWISENEHGWSPDEKTTYQLYGPDDFDMEEYDTEREAERARDKYTAGTFEIAGKWKYVIKLPSGAKWVRYDSKSAHDFASKNPGSTLSRTHVFQLSHPEFGGDEDFDTREEAETRAGEISDEFGVSENTSWDVYDHDRERTVETGFESEGEAQKYIDRNFESDYSVVENDEASGSVSPEVWSVKINDQMRESLLYEGQPLYKAEDVKKDINRVTQPSRRQDPKVYTERMALRRALQRESTAAAAGFQNAADRILGIQTVVQDAIEKLIPKEHRGKYLEEFAGIQDLDAADKFITKVQRDSIRLAKETTKNLEKDLKAAGQDAIKADREERLNLRRSLQRQSAAAREGAREATLALTSIKKGLADTINESLPPAERGRFNKLIASANTWRDVIKAIGRIDDATDKYARRVMVNSLKREVQRVQASQAIAIDYRWRVNDLLQGVVFGKPTAVTMLRAEQLQKFIDSQRKLGKDVTVPQYALNILRSLTNVPIDKIPTPVIEDVLGQVRQLAELGKTKLRTMKALDVMNKEKDLKDLAASTIPINSKQIERPFPGEDLGAGAGAMNVLKKAYNLAQRVSFSIKPMDVFFDMLDGMQNYAGPNYRVFKARPDAVFQNYLAENAQLREETVMMAKGLNRKNFARIGVYAIAVQGDGLEKLANLGYTPEQIKTIKLTPQEAGFYGFMRIKLEKMRPRIAETMRVTYNAALGEVENYFPYMTDFELADEADVSRRMAEQVLGFRKKTTEMGFTKARVGTGDQKVNIDALEVFLRHMDDAFYLVNVGPTIKYLGELANSDEYRALAGDFGTRMVRDWIDTMARKGGVVGGQQLAVLDKLRSNIGAATLAFKLSSTLVQTTPLIEGAALIGNYAFRGGIKFSLSPEWRHFVLDNMPEIAERGGDDPAMNEFVKGGPVREALNKTKEVGFWALKKLDEWAAAGVAAGAYQKFMDEKGIPIDFNQPNKEALSYAQRIVRRTQASPFFKDTPLAITRGMLTGNRSFDRAVLQFQNFVLNQYSLLTYEGGSAGVLNGRPGLSLSVWVWTILAIIATAGIRIGLDELKAEVLNEKHRKKQDIEEELIKQSVQELVSRIPFVSQATSLVTWGSMPVPALEAVRKLGEGASGIYGYYDKDNKRLHKQKKPFKKAVVKAVTAAGQVAGVPGAVEAGDLVRRNMK